MLEIVHALPREQPDLRERGHVFRSRHDAGEVLAKMLEPMRGSGALVMGIPAGGVPVAAVIAERLELQLDVAVVSKITPPWDTEVGYGAVAFDGTVRLNENAVRSFGLSQADVEQGIAKTQLKVQRRQKRLRAHREGLLFIGRPVILVDDGLASGFTMTVAVEALQHLGAKEIVVAVPTGHAQAVERVQKMGVAVICANVRSGGRFAVADAYLEWHDETEDSAARILAAPHF